MTLAWKQDSGRRCQKKCEFRKSKLLFLGHIVEENGIRPDPEKIAAITEMGQPSSMTEVRQFLRNG